MSPRSAYPWLRGVEESVPRRQRPRARVSALEIVAIVVVVAAVVGLTIWFVFFSGGGIGPGTV